VTAESPERGILSGANQRESVVEQVFCSSPSTNLVGVEVPVAVITKVIAIHFQPRSFTPTVVKRRKIIEPRLVFAFRKEPDMNENFNYEKNYRAPSASEINIRVRQEEKQMALMNALLKRRSSGGSSDALKKARNPFKALLGIFLAGF
jgi:hypothetical protein